jgi:hypothetical protein
MSYLSRRITLSQEDVVRIANEIQRYVVEMDGEEMHSLLTTKKFPLEIARIIASKGKA